MTSVKWTWFLFAVVLSHSEASLCFSTTHTPCATLHNNSQSVTVEVVPEASAQFFQHVAALVCYHEMANGTMCWKEHTQRSLCDGINCSSVVLSIVSNGHVLTSSRLGELLARGDTQLALLLTGYTLHHVYTDNESSPIPVASWICLVVGFLLSAMVLLKPLWWNRLVSRFCQRSK